MKEENKYRDCLEMMKRYRYSIPPDCGKEFLEIHTKQYFDKIKKEILRLETPIINQEIISTNRE